MQTILRRRLPGALVVACAASLLWAASPAAAESGSKADAAAPAVQTVKPDTVLATINGDPVTEEDVDIAEADLDAQFAQLPPDQKRAAALSALIEIRLVAAKAHSEGLDQDAEFQQRMDFLRQRALHSAYIQKDISDHISDADMRARYDKEIASAPPVNEVHARHILVATKEEAEAIIKQLEAGADFADLAKKNSKDGSASDGGDLGYFGPGQMVPEFEKAAFALQPGEFTHEPVKTDFGWHVIKVEDKRIKQPPSFDQVKEQVRSLMMREMYYQTVTDLRAKAAVDIKDPQLKALLAQDEAPQDGATDTQAPKP